MGVLSGRPKETVRNPPAQDHAVACPLFARLRGQLRPACMPFPGLHTPLHEPPQRVALDAIQGAPTQIGGDQRTRGRFVCIRHGHHTACGGVSAALEPGTADHGHARLPTPEAEALRRPGMGGTRGGHMWRPVATADVLIAADVRAPGHAAAACRGGIDTGGNPIERLRREAVHPDVGMVDREVCKQA